jgi:hypothetical protein
VFHEERQAYPRWEQFQSEVREATSSRKLRLLACACARRIWHLIPDVQCRRAVEVAERFADGMAETAELQAAWDEAREVCDAVFDARAESCTLRNEEEVDGYGVHEVCADACAWASVCYGAAQPMEDRFKDSILSALLDSATAVAHAVLPLDLAFSAYNTPPRRAALNSEAEAHNQLVRDIFGNPFRPVTFDPTWRTTTAVQLTQGIYDSRDFSTMPILADALQDAGCDNADILDHCRGPGPHVRGCWVVDLVLGKE